MLVETHIDGYVRDKVAVAIDRLRAFEPEEGYYLAFSGGKDSQCIYHLAVEAGVKFDAHYNVTGIDPPELVYFIRRNYPDVNRDMYKESFFKLLPKKGLPTRLKRWCCQELKERGGEGRICVTGVRWDESNARSGRRPFEVVTEKKEDKKLFNDNDEGRKLFENCMQKGKRVVNPIIDWLDEDVWEYLDGRKIEHCKLYDEGYKRIGCIGCPMAGNRVEELERNPKYYQNYLRAIERFVPKYLERRKKKGLKPFKETAQEMMDWWLEIEGHKVDYTDSFLED
jgi:phosphoadenosine phosphosulfate reductase